MQKQNKAIAAAIGAIVGGLVSSALIALGVTQEAGVPAEYQPLVQGMTTVLTAYAATWLSPKNAA